jgi:glycerol transport system substrate-binding protein
MAMWSTLSDWMAGEGKDVTLPTLDVDDFMGKSFTTGPDGKLYQLPDQQFANLYWFRYDWFKRDRFQKAVQGKYGYELGVPVNWSAYEDIAEFFTEHVREIDGKAVYGHMDYGKKAPDLGWRLPMPGSPWPVPATRVFPTASPLTNGASAWKAASRWVPVLPAAVPPMVRLPSTPCASIWMAAKIRAPGCLGMDFYTYLPSLANGNVAQQIFWYTAFTSQHGRTGTHGERRRHPQMAHGPLSPWPLLGRRHEAGLSGLRLLDLYEEYAS